jgi:hypothetical protein
LRRRRLQLIQPKTIANDEDGTIIMMLKEFLLFTYVESHHHK